MKTSRNTWKVLVPVMIATAAVLWTVPVLAGGVNLTLTRTHLTNVDDAAGRWQHQSGAIRKGAATVGQYAIHRRVTTGGTTAQNTAMQTVTLFFSKTGSPPQNITLQGAHDFSSGVFKGSVSAASDRYSWIQGAEAIMKPSEGGTNVLTLRWTASHQLTLP